MISGKYCLRTMEWMTPLAMPVVQPYVYAKIAGDACYLKPQANKQMNSFPPNYIHSLDATHMMLTALHTHRLGMTFSSVHDCFWTHAAHVPLMNTICRQQFINLHQIPLIELLGGQLSKTYLTEQLREDIGDEMFEKLEAQLLPMHTFGKLQIEEVANSVFFFS
jgi:DNA-directed RNA polymerase